MVSARVSALVDFDYQTKIVLETFIVELKCIDFGFFI